MKLQYRILRMVTALLALAVFGTAGVLTWNARRALLEQSRSDGILIAKLLARSARFADQVPRDVEEAIGDQMIVAATIASHMVAIAEQDADLPREEINRHLRQITDTTVLDEFWITDETGHAYLRNSEEFDFTFSPDPDEQPQAHIFWPLLGGEVDTVVQEARQREVDTQIFKYAGVGGIDQPRIVQVGYHVTLIDELRDQVGLERLTAELIEGGNILAIHVVDEQMVLLAYSAVQGYQAADLTARDQQLLRQAVEQGQPVDYQTDDGLKVIAPILGADGQVLGATLVVLPVDHVRAVMGHNLTLAAIVAGVIFVVGFAASGFLAQRVTKPVNDLTAASAEIEAGNFDLAPYLEEVTGRSDELGQLACVFRDMAQEVYSREKALREQVQELRIEIDRTRQDHAVAEITETEYFQELQKKARKLRDRAGKEETEDE
jgi:adenylate cyclase